MLEPGFIVSSNIADQTNLHGQEERSSLPPLAALPAGTAVSSILKTARPSLETVGDHLFPDPLDDSRVVVAVAKVVIQSREAMALARVFHLLQLLGLELRRIDVSPIEARGIHGKTRSHRTIGADDDVILTRPAIPVREVQAALGIAHDPRHGSDHLFDIAVRFGSVSGPTVFFQVKPRRHAHERFHLLQALHGIHHLISGLILLDDPVHQLVYGAPVLRSDVGGIVVEMF